MADALPQPNQIDDMRRHLELGERAIAIAIRGQHLADKGDDAGARVALSEVEDLHDERQLLEERWKPVGMGSVDLPQQPQRWRAIRSFRRRQPVQR